MRSAVVYSSGELFGGEMDGFTERRAINARGAPNLIAHNGNGVKFWFSRELGAAAR
jgi:hypothetical protein